MIAADGTNSRIAQQLGYNNNRRHIANLYAKSYFIQGFDSPCGQSIVTACAFLDAGPVYLFLLPRPEGDAWNLLVLSLEGAVDLQQAFETLRKDGRYAAWFKNVKVLQETAAVEQIYSPIIKPVRNGVIITGDAGSCQELECLGAMISGWRGGCAAATALKERELGIAPQALAAYEDWWLNTYIKQYDYQDYLSIFGLAYTMVKPEIIDYIFGLMGDRAFPPTFNPYTAVGLLGARLQSLMPKIMAERPDILQQLAGTMAHVSLGCYGRGRSRNDSAGNAYEDRHTQQAMPATDTDGALLAAYNEISRASIPRQLLKVQLTSSQIKVLMSFSEQDAFTMAELSRLHGVSVSTMTSMVDRLIQAGLLERQRR